jgi:hypothetical protein
MQRLAVMAFCRKWRINNRLINCAKTANSAMAEIHKDLSALTDTRSQLETDTWLAYNKSLIIQVEKKRDHGPNKIKLNALSIIQHISDFSEAVRAWALLCRARDERARKIANSFLSDTSTVSRIRELEHCDVAKDAQIAHLKGELEATRETIEQLKAKEIRQSSDTLAVATNSSSPVATTRPSNALLRNREPAKKASRGLVVTSDADYPQSDKKVDALGNPVLKGQDVSKIYVAGQKETAVDLAAHAQHAREVIYKASSNKASSPKQKQSHKTQKTSPTRTHADAPTPAAEAKANPVENANNSIFPKASESASQQGENRQKEMNAENKKKLVVRAAAQKAKQSSLEAFKEMERNSQEPESGSRAQAAQKTVHKHEVAKRHLMDSKARGDPVSMNSSNLSHPSVVVKVSSRSRAPMALAKAAKATAKKAGGLADN